MARRTKVITTEMRKARIAKLLALYVVDPITGCDIYQGRKSRSGNYGRNRSSPYGLFHWFGKEVRAHKLRKAIAMNVPVESWKFPETIVRHHCPSGDNGLCGNPDHLELGTPTDNNRDSVERGQHRSGRSPRKLTPALVLQIVAFLEEGMSQLQIALLFNVSNTTISDIARGRRWGSVTGITRKRKLPTK